VKKQFDIIFKTVIISFIMLSFTNCSRNNTNGIPEFQIIRFDQDLFRYLTENQPDSILQNHTGFLNILGEQVIDIGKTDSAGFFDRLKKYYSEPTLFKIFSDQQNFFSDITDIDNELSKGLQIFLQKFPYIEPPAVYMHVSGFYQNVIVSDDILSLSADKYLGSDYPVYRNYFFEYKRESMTRERITPDYLYGFMMANLPFFGQEDVLLDRMIYEGKLRYFLSKILPKRNDWEIIGYNEEQYVWCGIHQMQIWNTVIENDHLLSPNYFSTAQYLKDAPHTAYLPADAPGRVGVWLGFQIVSAYMKEKPRTKWQDLMENTDYREILRQSKFR